MQKTDQRNQNAWKEFGSQKSKNLINKLIKIRIILRSNSNRKNKSN